MLTQDQVLRKNKIKFIVSVIASFFTPAMNSVISISSFQRLTFLKHHLQHDAVSLGSVTGVLRLPSCDPGQEADATAVGGRQAGASGQTGQPNGRTGTAHTCPDRQSHQAFLQLLFKTG